MTTGPVSSAASSGDVAVAEPTIDAGGQAEASARNWPILQGWASASKFATRVPAGSSSWAFLSPASPSPWLITVSSGGNVRAAVWSGDPTAAVTVGENRSAAQWTDL